MKLKNGDRPVTLSFVSAHNNLFVLVFYFLYVQYSMYDVYTVSRYFSMPWRAGMITC